MILIEFPDRDTEIKGLTVLMSRFSGKVLRGRLHIVPENDAQGFGLVAVENSVPLFEAAAVPLDNLHFVLRGVHVSYAAVRACKVEVDQQTMASVGHIERQCRLKVVNHLLRLLKAIFDHA